MLGCCFLQFLDGVVLGDGGGGDGGGRVDLEGGERVDALFLADLGVFVAIDGSNPENSIVLVDPFVELGREVVGLSVWVGGGVP